PAAPAAFADVLARRPPAPADACTFARAGVAGAAVLADGVRAPRPPRPQEVREQRFVRRQPLAAAAPRQLRAYAAARPPIIRPRDVRAPCLVSRAAMHARRRAAAVRWRARSTIREGSRPERQRLGHVRGRVMTDTDITRVRLVEAYW